MYDTAHGSPRERLKPNKNNVKMLRSHERTYLFPVQAGGDACTR